MTYVLIIMLIAANGQYTNERIPVASHDDCLVLARYLPQLRRGEWISVGCFRREG